MARHLPPSPNEISGIRPSATLLAGWLPIPPPHGMKLWPIANFRPIAVSSRLIAAPWEGAVGPPSTNAPSRAAGRWGVAGVSALTERTRTPTSAGTRLAAIRIRTCDRPPPACRAAREGTRRPPARGPVWREPRLERIGSPPSAAGVTALSVRGREPIAEWSACGHGRWSGRWSLGRGGTRREQRPNQVGRNPSNNDEPGVAASVGQ